MASFTKTEYGKFASLQNISGSADAAAPEGGVYLFASGTAGSAKLYLQNEGASSLIDLDSVLDIAGDSGTGTVSSGQTLTIAGGTGLDTSVSGQTVTFSMDLNEMGAGAVAVGADSFAFVDADDNATKKESIADLMTAVAGDGLAASSGVLAVGVDDSSIELNSDALRVKAQGITNAMLADDAVGADELAANAVVNASIASNAAIDMDKLDGGSLASSLSDLAQGDLMYAGDADDSNNLKSITFSNLEDAIFGNVSGDATIAAGGALTIGANAVEGSMINSNAAGDGLGYESNALKVQTTGSAIRISSDNLALSSSLAGDGLAMSSGSLNNLEVLKLDLNELTAAAVDVAADSIAIVDANDSNASRKESIADLMTAVAGDGLAASSGVLAVDMNELSDAAVASGDKFVFIDATDNSTKKESIDDISTFQAGTVTSTGLAASSGVLKLDIQNMTAETGVADGDLIVVDDGANGTLRKMTRAHFIESAALDAIDIDGGAIDGTPIGASAQSTGQFSTLSGSGVMSVVGAATFGGAMALSGNANFDGQLDVASVVNLAASGVATTVRGTFNVDEAVTFDSTVSGSGALQMVGSAEFGNSLLASGSITAKSHFIAGGNSIVDGGSNSVITFDGSGNTGVVNNMTVGGGYGSTGVTISSAGAIQANGGATVDGALSVGGGYGSTGATISAAGALQLNSGLTVDDAATFGGGYGSTGVTISNAGNIQANGDMTLDGAMTFGGGYGSSGATISSAGAIQADGALTIGSDGSGVDAKFFGAAANEYMLYDASENLLQLARGGSVLVSLGGDADSEYAVDVANGSDNVNKMRAAAFVTYSDESLKSDVASMSNTALDTVMSLEGVEFTWKDSGERDFGFIAQDVQAVLPKAVHTAGNGVQGVDYSRLTSVLVEAVKAQQVQIADLKKALTNLKK